MQMVLRCLARQRACEAIGDAGVCVCAWGGGVDERTKW